MLSGVELDGAEPLGGGGGGGATGVSELAEPGGLRT